MNDLLNQFNTLIAQNFELYDEQAKNKGTIDNTKALEEVKFQTFMLSTKYQGEIFNLINRLNYYKAKYNEGSPVVSDEEYDSLYFDLLTLEKMSGIVMEDTPTKVVDLNSISDDNLMTYDYKHDFIPRETYNFQEVVDFVNNLQTTVAVIEPEGITCYLEYNQGYLIAAVAYEPNVIDKNILKKALSAIPTIPRRINYQKKLIIKGKLTSLITQKIYYKALDKSKTIHNLILDSLNDVDLSPYSFQSIGISFLATDIIYGLEDMLYFYQKMCFINELGFAISQMMNLAIIDLPYINYLKGRGHQRELSFSRIFFKKNESKENNYKNTLYYHCYDLIYSQKLKNIIWEFKSNQDILIPVLFHTPLIIDDQIICHTKIPFTPIYEIINNLLDNKLYYNQTIYIYKTYFLNSHLKDIDNNPKPSSQSYFNSSIIPTICPYCGAEIKYNYNIPYETKDYESFKEIKFIECPNENCQGKLFNRIKHFFGEDGLNIIDFSEDLLRWLVYEKKWINNLTDIYILEKYRKEWSCTPNFNKHIVSNLLNNIENSKKCSFAEFLSALSISFITKEDAIKIANHFKTYENFLDSIYFEENNLLDNALALNDNQIQSLLEFDYCEANMLWKIMKYGEKIDYTANYFDMPLRNQTYVVVGPVKYFDSVEWLCGYIHGIGGAVISQVTENVDYVINNNPESNCPENIAARELNIPIITEEEFLSNIY